MSQSLILLSALSEPLFSAQLFARYLSLLPPREQAKIRSFKRQKSAVASLIGRILLIKMLELRKMGETTLDHLQYSENGRPFFGGDFDFSIAHSGNYVICASGTGCKMGADIELIAPKNIAEFDFILADAEKRRLDEARLSPAVFFDIWTKKEAIIKADGRTFDIPLTDVDTTQSPVSIEGRQWYTQPLFIHPDYVLNMACNYPIGDIEHISVIL